MRPQLLMFCFGVFIIGTLLSLAYSGDWLRSEEIDVINQLTSFNVTQISIMGGWSIPQQVTDFFNALVTVLAWQYPFLDNTAGLIFKMIFLYPVTLGCIIAITQLFISVVQGIASVVKSLLPG
jgi:hypothetical protein